MEIPSDKDALPSKAKCLEGWNSQSALRPSIGAVGQSNPSFLEVNGACVAKSS